MFGKLKKRLQDSFIETDTAVYTPRVEKIRLRENELKGWDDDGLKKFAYQLILSARSGQPLEALLTDIYALVSETAFRTLKMRPYDVQIMAAIALNEGKVVEMQTGEGKTLTATMPAFLHAMDRQGVHIHTFNDYLAKRDANWMRPIFEFLGLSVGFIQEEMGPDARKAAYQKDITYLTAREGGFDFLRSLLRTDPEETIRRKAHFAIIDEVDSILIDEARIPLVIAGDMGDELNIDLYQLAHIVSELTPDKDFETDEFKLNIFLTDQGLEKVERSLGIHNLYAKDHEVYLVKVNIALQAHWLLNRDIDYIVRKDGIELIDEFTGRVVENRRWPHGLQAAIEAKEGLNIQPEGAILGKTTLQHFFSTYPKLSGMTGTAQAAAEEFFTLYGMPVAVTPTNKTDRRIDFPDQIFSHKEAKFNALLNEIGQVHSTGRPILVGTTSVEESEMLAKLLLDKGVECQVLNAKNDELEAKIIAKAGIPGALTISTNMAGRGTDIKLGGEAGIEREKILQLGGLYVIGTNRFESKRIDNQLRGRAGRQGDPGSSCFFVSLEDNIHQKHGIDELIPARYRVQQENPLIHPLIRREVDRLQRIVEGKNFDIRQTLRKNTLIVEVQAEIIAQRRHEVLHGDFESLLEKEDPEFYRELIEKHGKDSVLKAESQLTLFVIDKYRAIYLEEIDRIRQSIHLVVLGGMNPLQEFQKKMAELFPDVMKKINREIIRMMKVVTIGPDGINLEKEGLMGPSSTWTYLVNDNPFGDKLEMMLGSNSNIGFAAAAGLMWPLLGLYFLVSRLFGKKRKRVS